MSLAARIPGLRSVGDQKGKNIIAQHKAGHSRQTCLQTARAIVVVSVAEQQQFPDISCKHVCR